VEGDRLKIKTRTPWHIRASLRTPRSFEEEGGGGVEIDVGVSDGGAMRRVLATVLAAPSRRLEADCRRLTSARQIVATAKSALGRNGGGEIGEALLTLGKCAEALEVGTRGGGVEEAGRVFDGASFRFVEEGGGLESAKMSAVGLAVGVAVPALVAAVAPATPVLTWLFLSSRARIVWTALNGAASVAVSFVNRPCVDVEGYWGGGGGMMAQVGAGESRGGRGMSPRRLGGRGGIF
jgi:hypothetical protein